MKALFLLLLVVFSLSLIATAQPRPVEKSNTIDPTTPDSFEVRYEGGVFGMSGKEKGTLRFDEANERVVFYRADKKEMFGISYDAMLTIYPDSKESVPQTGKVISALPLPGAGLANLLSKDTKYAILSFEDTEIGQRPTVSFRFDNKKELLGFINKLGVKAKLTQRGDAYYRPKKAVF